MTDKSAAGVRATIEALMSAGTQGDLSGLNQIYHEDMQILMLDEQGELMRFDKNSFMRMIADTVRGSDPADHKWAQFNAVDADENRGHVLITRKVPLAGDRKKLTLSIDLEFQDDRWQVMREVIFVRPDPDHATH